MQPKTADPIARCLLLSDRIRAAVARCYPPNRISPGDGPLRKKVAQSARGLNITHPEELDLVRHQPIFAAPSFHGSDRFS